MFLATLGILEFFRGRDYYDYFFLFRFSGGKLFQGKAGPCAFKM